MELREPGPGEALVRVEAAGICHSDLNALEGRSAPPGWPLICGHEGLGVVTALGPGADSVQVGQRVLFCFVASCLRCSWCLRGEHHLCSSFRASKTPKGRLAGGTEVFGHAGLGAFAEEALVDHRSLVPVDSKLDAAQLALVSCGVTTGVSAVEHCAKVEPASSVAVFGAGGVGLAVVQAARLAGATTVIVVDPVPQRRQRALGLGATIGVGPQDAVLDIARDATGGRGVDYAFDAVGRADASTQGFAALRRGGMLVIVGSAPAGDRPGWSLYEQMRDAKTVKGSLYGNAFPHRDFARLIARAESGQFDLGAMVTRRLRLDEVNDGIEALQNGSGLRSVIVF
ncbi:zinc-binding dehydrogenase [Dactylosporangium sp. CA-092794]|uniref:zinc-binding dehydrogenase n=1 Tax=Dactylosporangium sp. CA-092794 TaxID=3239929 RepID=UPI003D94674A